MPGVAMLIRIKMTPLLKAILSEASAVDPTSFISAKLLRDYDERTWTIGQCANLAFGLSTFLSKVGVRHKLMIDGGGNHVWVRIGRRDFDADRFNTTYKSGGETTLDREQWMADPSGFTKKYEILLTPRRVSSICADFMRDHRRPVSSEADLESSPSLDALETRYRPDLDVALGFQKPGIVKLYTIRAKKNAPPGLGTRFMEDLCSWADENGVILVLTLGSKQWGRSDPKTPWKQTTSSDRLKKWYSNFGFVSSHGKRTYRPDLGSSMHRHPR